jgi:hypothetical protein
MAVEIEYAIQQAKDMILTLFKEKGTLDYIEILETLDLDLETIVKACDELGQEGRIEDSN